MNEPTVKQPLQVEPKREPLTDEQILLVLRNIDPETKRLSPGLKALVQEIEAAHGIGEK